MREGQIDSGNGFAQGLSKIVMVCGAGGAALLFDVYYQLTDHFIVAADSETAWDFFSDANNLSAITPGWLKFTMGAGNPRRVVADSVLDYTLSWMGVGVKWRTLIIDWDPPRKFIDLQVRGPYAVWHHEHSFAASEKGTVCRDRVIYKLPGGPIGRVVHAAMVRRQLMEIFTHRREVIGKRLGWVEAVQEKVEIKAL